VLFVCTKRQLASIVRSEAERAGAMYVTERWLGGLLTNYATVKKQTKRLKELEAGAGEGGEFENYTKKEQLMFNRQREKLEKNLSGIKSMTRLPGILFVVDAKKERIAVTEANKLGLPIVAICDTNSDPDLITVPIAGNDDAIRSVELITKYIADTIIEARREAPLKQEAEETESFVYSSDRGTESTGEDDRRRRRKPRRRRASPAAVAARLKTPGGDGAPDAGGESSDGGDAGDAAPAGA
jgi:small subunit ribosomal protein S2